MPWATLGAKGGEAPVNWDQVPRRRRPQRGDKTERRTDRLCRPRSTLARARLICDLRTRYGNALALPPHARPDASQTGPGSSVTQSTGLHTLLAHSMFASRYTHNSILHVLTHKSHALLRLPSSTQEDASNVPRSPTQFCCVSILSR